MEAVYLLLGLAVVGALIYALMQVNARQQRLHAELTRLERLTAEVTMNAEAVLEQVDQRIERLNQLAAALEAKATRAADEPPAPAAQPSVVGDQAPPDQEAPQSGKPRKRIQARRAPKEAKPEPAAVKEEPVQAEEPRPPEPQAPADRSAERRQAVFALADQGKTPLEIAEALSIPRGEVQLMLNLRGRKVSSR